MRRRRRECTACRILKVAVAITGDAVVACDAELDVDCELDF